MTDPMIEVHQLHKRYRLSTREPMEFSLRDALGRCAQRVRGVLSGAVPGTGSEWFWSLKDVSFSVQEGEVLGVVGQNGAGKSTLLKVLSRITAPTEGEAILRGRIGSLLEVGTGFHNELTGRENIYLSGAILGMRREEIVNKFDAIVSFAEIERFIDMPIKRYSSGMKVRLGFAVAAHLEPEILMIDEVLAVGDAAFRRKCMGAMGEVSKRGRTILFVSHNMAQIRRLCDRALWLEHGTVRALGDATEVSLAYEQSAMEKGGVQDGVFERDVPADATVWVSRVVLRNAQGEASASFGYGEDLFLDLEIASRPLDEIEGHREYGLVWQLTDESDVRLSSGASEWLQQTYPAGTRHVRIVLRRIPLYRGAYKLTLGITRLPAGRIDTWRDAAVFQVAQCSPYESGYEMDSRSGFVHIDYEFQAIDEEI